MKDTSTQPLVIVRLWQFIAQHWFKLGVGILMLYALLSKDFVFNVHIQSPSTPANTPHEMAPPTQKSRRETLTDNATYLPTQQMDLLPHWGDANVRGHTLLSQLTRVSDTDIQAFIRRFAHVAQAEQSQYGIPASIILAHGLLKSNAGQAPFTATGNNFFALTCTDDWEDQTQDDPTRTYTCLRKYDNAWLSFRDHSLFYTTGKHAGLRNLDPGDYRAWAKALRKSPYNDVKAIDDQLLTIIERFQLTQFD